MSLLGLRIRIRPVCHEDLPFLQALWNDGTAMRFHGYPEGMRATEEDMERWWQSLQRAQQAHHGLAALPSPHALIETTEGAPIGELTYALDAKQRASIDLKLSPACWKQGYALEALRIVMRELFATTGTQRVIAAPAPDNAPARRLLEKLGFHFAPTENHPHRWACDRQDFAATMENTA